MERSIPSLVAMRNWLNSEEGEEELTEKIKRGAQAKRGKLGKSLGYECCRLWEGTNESTDEDW